MRGPLCGREPLLVHELNVLGLQPLSHVQIEMPTKGILELRVGEALEFNLV